MEQVAGLEPGFVLCVSRLLPYKNVDAVVRAFESLPRERLVVAGAGPEEPRLRAIAGRNTTFAGRVTDAGLRWLYANCSLLVAASYEDFGLTPLEAACFGKPTVALRWGGYLDSIGDANGIFFDAPVPAEIAAAIRQGLATKWRESRDHPGRGAVLRSAASSSACRRSSATAAPDDLGHGGPTPSVAAAVGLG